MEVTLHRGTLLCLFGMIVQVANCASSWTKYLVINSTVPVTSPTKSVHVRHYGDCAILCNLDDCCASFVLTQGQTMCDLHYKAANQQTQPEDGAVLYRKDPPLPCACGFTQGAPDGHCYMRLAAKSNGNNARSACEVAHPMAYLANVNSAEEQATINELGGFIWLGGVRENGATVDETYWSQTGENITTSDFQNWYPSHPKNNGNCLWASSGGKWELGGCGMMRLPMCEYE